MCTAISTHTMATPNAHFKELPLIRIQNSARHLPLSPEGEADSGKDPVDLSPAERVHTVLVLPGGNDRGEGMNSRRYSLIQSLHPNPKGGQIPGEEETPLLL